jgi:hypothetical protein
MKRASPTLAIVFFLGCLALAVLAFRQRSEIVRADSVGAAAHSQIDDLQHQVLSLKAARDQSDKQIAQLTAASASQKAQSGGDSGGTRIVHISDILKEHPEYTAIYMKQFRRNVDRMYGSGLSNLNLPPDQLSQLKNLLAERQMSNTDAEQAAQAAGLVPGTPAWQAAMSQASQDVQHQISSILGPNSDSILAQLQARSNIQSQVQYNYAPDFEDAGIPLTPEQTNGLIQAMADANYAGKDTSTRPPDYNVPDPTSGLSPHDDRIINNATPVLSAAQIQLLTTDQAENEQIAAVMKAYSSGGVRPVFVP